MDWVDFGLLIQYLVQDVAPGRVWMQRLGQLRCLRALERSCLIEP
jgi:hypothetical protein